MKSLQPLAIGVHGGFITSTLLTLVVIPFRLYVPVMGVNFPLLRLVKPRVLAESQH